MRNLLNFLIKYNSWFVFLFYIAVSCILLFNGNRYHQSIYLTSANGVSASVYGTVAGINEYFNLRDVNRDLQLRNASLENELLNLQDQLKHYRALMPDSSEFIPTDRFRYVMASVINNSVSRPRNYFTINKGSLQGVKPGMGVVDRNGIVGIVNVVGANSARIISLLNITQHFSVKVKGSNYVGSLTWHDGNPEIAYVEEMPRHVKYHIGDTIVTSGYSTTFPEGIPVGTVMSQIKTSDDNFFTLKIRLAADFKQLSTVRVIIDNLKQELDSLQTFDALDEI